MPIFKIPTCKCQFTGKVDDFNKLVTTFQDQGKAMTETDIKVELIKQGKCLDILIYDEDEYVRAEAEARLSK